MTPETNVPPLSEEGLWDAWDVARYLKVSRSWVYRESGKGNLPVRKVLGLLRFDPAEIRALRDASAVQKGAVVLPLAGPAKPGPKRA